MDTSIKELLTNGISVESDMRAVAYSDEDPFTTKVFKAYPLIGEYVPSEATFQKWQANTKAYVEKRLSNKSLRFKQWVYEQVALTVVQYAKNWNSNEEGRFTKYVAMQLGFKDESGKVWALITDAIESAFMANGRLFIKRNGDREFYETVMTHSFGPNKSWYPLIDLLFSFYSVNLEWNYVPHDPLFAKLVQVLQRHFNFAATDEDQYLIASSTYSLRVGIRRLVQERPAYCVRLFESIVRRIHQLLKNETTPANRFSFRMVDEWFAARISNAETVSTVSARAIHEPSEVALDYKGITLRYILANEKLAVRIPAIRLLGDETGDACVTIYEQNRRIATYELDIHGNELGETIQPKTIVLPCELLSNEELQFRLVISRGASVIHDTERRFWRSVVFFSDGKEVSINRIKKEKYIVYAAKPEKLEGSNVDIEKYPNGLVEVSPHKNYTLKYAGNTIAIDSSEISGIRIVSPSIYEAVHYVLDGTEYSVTKPGAALKVYCSDKSEAHKYSVLINGTAHPLIEFFDVSANNRCLIDINSVFGNTVEISIVDFSAGVSIFKENYTEIPEFSYVFSNKCYVGTEEILSARATATCGAEQIALVASDDRVQGEYKSGLLSIDIPCIKYSFINIGSAFFDKYYRFEDIEETSRLVFNNKSGMPFSVIIGGVTINNPDVISLLDYLTFENLQDVSPIQVVVLDKPYVIAEIIRENYFVSTPTIVFDNNTLKWDGGMSFIGDASAELILALNKHGNEYLSFEVILGKQIIRSFENDVFEDGVYDWVFYANGASISSGNCFIGNKSKARFSGKIIRIDKITEDTELHSPAIKIKEVFIDQIKYIDTCYVPTEDDVYDVYSGCMYWVTYSGDKRYLSFRYADTASGKTKYKVNPVKIIYISDKYLRIINEDDEGLYCFNNRYSANPGYEITDIEPGHGAKGYIDVLFYSFAAEDINPKRYDINTVLPIKETAEKSPIIEVPKAIIKAETLTPIRETSTSLQSMVDVDQNTVINAGVHERILVNAGPGTGKTWTLIERIIKLVQLGTDPECIQALCFSRAAVEVVRNRMSAAIESGRVDVSLNQVDIRTFDSFASQLLYWVKDSDYKEVNKSTRIEDLSYEERINLFVKVLNSQPGLIEQCEHLIVDEVQDLVMSRADMVITLIDLLPQTSGVTLFGDACQAIYDYQVDNGMSSVDFYNEIEATNQFKYYSFSRNYRQASQMKDYCESYRSAILSNDMVSCNAHLSKVAEHLPDFKVVKIRNFEEDSLDGICSSGNVGILTRSNAQALMISNIFRKKNIQHRIQRRLSEDGLSGWIAMLLNSAPAKVYDSDSFIASALEYCKDYFDEDTATAMWELVLNAVNSSSDYVKARDMLVGLRQNGKNRVLSAQEPATITVSTIHRSKGREYDTVILLDSLISEQTENPEEHRVNYVALSRAKRYMYKVEMDKFFFSTLADRRCFTAGFAYSGKRFLSYLEIGKKDDFIARSFCEDGNVQDVIRQRGLSLIGKELLLEKCDHRENGHVVYNLILKENGLCLARTSADFAQDLDDAIRQTKKLPWHASIYDSLYPKRFSGVYALDIDSEISMIQGNESGVREYEGLIAWNTIVVEGYAKAEY